MDKSLEDAWSQYKDLYDRHMFLLRLIGETTDIEDIKDVYEAQIAYALEEWISAQEKYEDFGLSL